jgi:hypothetical protein
VARKVGMVEIFQMTLAFLSFQISRGSMIREAGEHGCLLCGNNYIWSVLQSFGMLLSSRAQAGLHCSLPFYNLLMQKLNIPTWPSLLFGLFCINTSSGMAIQHIIEFGDIWKRVREVHLIEGRTLNAIIWKFTASV